jgi:hypothetical protein
VVQHIPCRDDVHSEIGSSHTFIFIATISADDSLVHSTIHNTTNSNTRAVNSKTMHSLQNCTDYTRFKVSLTQNYSFLTAQVLSERNLALRKPTYDVIRSRATCTMNALGLNRTPRFALDTWQHDKTKTDNSPAICLVSPTTRGSRYTLLTMKETKSPSEEVSILKS